MTLLHLFRPAKVGLSPPRRDHSVVVVVILMMTLVFAPVVGMHVTALALGSGVAPVTGADRLNATALWPPMLMRSPG
jgi:hypothetical protein